MGCGQLGQCVGRLAGVRPEVDYTDTQRSPPWGSERAPWGSDLGTAGHSSYTVVRRRRRYRPPLVRGSHRW